MALISLHRASRIIDAIHERALKVHTPKVLVKISVFAADPAAELTQKQAECREAVAATARLLKIRANLRAAVDVANAEHGIAPLLRSKQAAEDLVSALEKLPGVAAEQRLESDDEMIYRRRPKKAVPPPILDVAATLAMIEATKARYAAADGSVVSEVDVSAVDAGGSKEARRMAAEARREADQLAEELRALNATRKIEVADEDLHWLTAHEVV